MRRVLCAAILGLLACGAAFAEKDDQIMGNYQGAFTSNGGGHSLRAEVIGEPKRRFRVNMIVGHPGGESTFTVTGKGREGEATIEDEAAFNGEKMAVKAKIENGVFTGTFGESAFELKRVILESPTLGAPAPEGAVVLFDGKNTDAWDRTPLGWCIQDDGSMEVCSSSLVTKQSFGSAQFHAEFMNPYMPNEIEQARGNSGFYVQGRYEVQVLDSFGNEPKWDYCGGIYKVAVPLKNASYPPLTWQTYDITYHAPKFDANGAKTQNARITVVHNGVTIHDNLELPDVTPGGISGTEAAEGPLMLQDHHDPVRYRNIWVKPLAE